MKVIGFYNKSVWLTVFSIALTVSAVTLRFPLKYMMLVLVIAGICDLFDGAVARKCKRTEQEKEFGIQLDTLADIINFGVYPAVIYSTAVGSGPMTAVMCCIYVFCAVERLAFFNVITHENQGVFRGLPSTYAALIIPAVHVLIRIAEYVTSMRDGSFYSGIFPAVYLLLSILFILDFKMKKPRGKMYIVFGVLAIVLAVSVLL